MKTSDLTVNQLVLAAARMDIVDFQDFKVSTALTAALNDLAWRSKWRKNSHVHTKVESASTILDVFKACRAWASHIAEPIVRLQLLEGDLKGRFIYEIETARLTFRDETIEAQPKYRVFFCHPEGEDVEVLEGSAAQQPYEVFDIPESLFELPEYRPSQKNG